MLRFRMFEIACGYEDADDCDALRGDPLFKLAVGRAAESGRDLCSQPTMSRLEIAPSRREVARMTAALVDLFCRSFPTPPATITLDIDDKSGQKQEDRALPESGGGRHVAARDHPLDGSRRHMAWQRGQPPDRCRRYGRDQGRRTGALRGQKAQLQAHYGRQPTRLIPRSFGKLSKLDIPDPRRVIEP